MTLTFRYKRVKRGNIDIKSPSIPINLSGNGSKYQFIALIDSGADVSVIPQEVAELLDLDLSGKREEASGIGGKVEAVQSRVFLDVGKGHENYSFNLPVKVILNKNGAEMPILLGREGFFNRFVITFNQKEEKVLLKNLDS
ncbi:MAG: aspartyl protease family protein [Nanoarchaeota archaeon]